MMLVSPAGSYSAPALRPVVSVPFSPTSGALQAPKCAPVPIVFTDIATELPNKSSPRYLTPSGRPADSRCSHCAQRHITAGRVVRLISGRPIPADLGAVKVLAAAPALLDLFVWLSYRCFVAKGPEVIPLFGPFGLTQQLGCVEYSRPSRFRAMLEQWLRTIRCLWPECPAFISADGRTLRIDRQTALQAHQIAT